MRQLPRKMVISLAATLLYLGSYLLLVEARPLTFMSGVGPWQRVPTYRVGGMAAEMFFAPVQYLDKRLRPARWQYP